MPVDWSTALSDDQIRRATDQAAFARGLDYARGGHVVSCDFNADTLALTGVVRGSTPRPYLARVDLSMWARDAHAPRARGYATTCTCPMRGACKHTVAVMLVARERQAATPGAVAAWEHSLGALLPTRTADPAGATPLALQLEVVHPKPSRFDGTPVAAGPRLLARPVARGRSGAWVRTGISWHELRFGGARQRGFDDEHLALMHELSELESSGYSYVSTQTIDLSLVRRPLWDLLDRACELQLALVLSGPGSQSVEVVREPASVGLDVTRGDTGDLAVRTRIDLGGSQVSLAEAHLLGRPVHGFFTEPGAGGDPARLVRLDRPMADPLQRFVERVGALDIPSADAPRFLTRYWPALRQTVRIGSSDDSVAPPVVTGPWLHLRVCYDGPAAAALAWSFGYEVDGCAERHPIADAAEGTDDAGARARDLAAEQALLRRDDLPVEPIALRAWGRVVPEQRLTGLEVLDLAEQTLPLLRELPGIEVEVVGDAPTFRLTEVAPVVGVSATDTDDADWFDLGITVSIEGEEVPFGRLFAALAAGESVLVLDSGTWFRLDRPELQILRRLIEEARELTDRPARTLRLNAFHAGLWEELVDLGVVEEQSLRWAGVVGGLLEIDAMPSPEPPPGLRARLRPYQLDGYRWLRFLHEHSLGGILADDMGLGKTVQTLALVSHARGEHPTAPPFLVVAPTSVVGNWAAEAARFSPDLRVVTVTETERRRGSPLHELVAGADLVVTSYALFRIDDAAYQASAWEGLLLDEAQFVKNHQAKTYQCARRLVAPFKLAITGTPLENNLMELWSLLSIVAPGLYPSPQRFAEHVAKPIERGQGADRLTALRRRIRPLMLRRTKEQVATDLPAKQESVLPVELSARHQRIYQTRLQRERQKILKLIDDIDAHRLTIFTSLTTLRQLSLDPVLVDANQATVGSAKTDALIEMLTDVVGEGHRALVFSQFTGYLRLVRDRLDAAGIRHAYLDGRTRRRQQAIDDFKGGDVPVFVISLKAGGVGLNLTEADYVFVLDPWWNPAVEAQAVDRAHRIGQTRHVMVYRLVSRDTIETKVMELKARKAALFSSVMETEGGFAGALSADDIRGLFD